MSSDASTLRPHGGYRRLRSFQVTEIIYDGTVAFCQRFVDKRSRTHNQMVQAARSGQNIAEGSRASATSSQTELRLWCCAQLAREPGQARSSGAARVIPNVLRPCPCRKRAQEIAIEATPMMSKKSNP